MYTQKGKKMEFKSNPFKTSPERPRELMTISNRLLESVIKKNNPITLKMLLYIGKKLQQTGIRADSLVEPIYTIDINYKELCAECNITADTIRKHIINIQKTILQFEYANGDWESAPIIAHAKGQPGKGTLTVKILREILNLVVTLEKRFTIIDPHNAMRLTSQYSLRLIPILEHIAAFDAHIPKRKRYNLEQLNAIFGTEYKRVGEIIEKVIKPVQTEMQKVSTKAFMYTVDYEAVPRGRPKAAGITIDLIKNQPSLI